MELASGVIVRGGMSDREQIVEHEKKVSPLSNREIGEADDRWWRSRASAGVATNTVVAAVARINDFNMLFCLTRAGETAA